MNSPGNDWIAVTGQVASGCTLVVFTTGRGSAFGFKPAPVIKVCSDARTYNRMPEDMDVNAGRLLEGTPMKVLAAELLDLIVAVAPGDRRGRILSLGPGRDPIGRRASADGDRLE
jgi:altronate hydrolase